MKVITKVIHIECPHCSGQFPKTVKIKEGVLGESTFQDNCPICGKQVTVKLDAVLTNNTTVLRGE
jgi:endogenous inhibitor of DNA gyrase (YacG/DUF329 family)